MKYRDLLDKLNDLSDDQLDQDVIVDMNVDGKDTCTRWVRIDHPFVEATTIQWGSVTETQLTEFWYTGKTYAAVPYYYPPLDENGEWDDEASYVGDSYEVYNRLTDVPISVIQTIGKMDRVPRPGERVGIRVYRDDWTGGDITDTAVADIYWDDSNGEWDKHELVGF